MIELNEEQSKAVQSPAKRKLVIAGPGSGKTRTLCAAVADAVRRGVPAEAVACVTYTNAAAAEMRTRLKEEHGLERVGFVGTLHSLMLSLLREHPEAVGLPERLSVIDDEQREAVMQSIMDDMGIRGKAKRALEAREVRDRLADMPTRKEELARAEYDRQLAAAGLLDFDAILRYGERLLRAGKHGGHKALFVDEYQDAADRDAMIYALLPAAEKFWVGDPDQAIFGFRGGNMRHIEAQARRIREGGTNWELHLLETNYRSGAAICEAAQRLIERNTLRVPKATKPGRSEGGAVSVRRCSSPGEELSCVLEQIVKGGHPATDYAVLARTNKQVEAVAQHLAANGVPVRRAEHKPEPDDWRRTKLLLTVLDNPWNDFAVHQLMRATDAKEADAARRSAEANMVGLNEWLGWRYGKGEGLAADVDLGRHGVSAESRGRVHAGCRELSKVMSAWTIADLLLHLNASDQLRREEGEGVTCATMHGAKGREFRRVFVVGCEEGTLPNLRAKGSMDVEEERRLMYVAMTRAMDELVLTWCDGRPENRGPNMPPGPVQERTRSRFISEAGL